MTYLDLIAQVISEVSGKPQESLAGQLEAIHRANPGGGKLDMEVPPAEVEKLLAEFRAIGPGILRWLREGAAEARQH